MTDIQVKRIYDPPSPQDGLRVLVDRLWPRGLSRAAARVDGWWRELAPSNELRKWVHADPARWAEFRRRYERELRGRSEELSRMVAGLPDGRVTLLFAARDTERNNAVALAAFLHQLIVDDKSRPRSPEAAAQSAAGAARRAAGRRTATSRGPRASGTA